MATIYCIQYICKVYTVEHRAEDRATTVYIGSENSTYNV